mmetsp:Transcript_24033/g.70481  ORF Transcript_24033/g.70481 Transcript_24033/m.70481 type:complete len:326 (-) Transcript_24033:369-1346(-)|eukprot:CAMPEP_0118974252 /NCGR_PEP_ID=MMETSP1173-20130426/11151_1 /TAXON_ID=1034831 /ORGANISM="Rhizochromulina marina cf, Strain CCMP1243" /LENGTH=325 /DNA_ID=CAMNT_0006923965 /DNA_START=55 /DNA_END=1032 /DNA_ORIENTATION=-
MAGEDGLTSVLFYMIIVYPTTSWLLNKFKSKNRGLYLAIGFLALIAGVKTYFDVQEKGPNFYTRLGVTRNSSLQDLKKAYKRLSLELHPDKNPSPNAVEEFDQIKDAYDVLTGPDRETYNKFGEEKVKAGKIIDEYQVLLEISIFYLTWGMLAYMLTLGKSSRHAREWVFTGQIVMLVVEVSLMLQEVKLPDWLFPTMTENDMVWLLHTLFPAYMNGCRVIGSFLFVDVEEQTRALLNELRDSHDEIKTLLREVVANMNTSGGAGRTIKLPAPTKIKHLEGLGASSSGNSLASQLRQEVAGSQKGTGMGFYLMIVGYIALYYFFS